MSNGQKFWQYSPFAVLALLILAAVFASMMLRIVLLFVIFGALLGWMRAMRRDGTLADKYQWAAVHGLILMIVGFIVSVIAV